HLPLATVLGWGLDEVQVGQLLQLPASITTVDGIVHDPDRLFATWQQELGDPRRSTPALLEVQALLRRVLAVPVEGDPVAPSGDHDADRVADQSGRSTMPVGVARMAQFIVEHFSEPITIAD